MSARDFRILLIEDNPDDAGWIGEVLAEVRQPQFELAQAERLGQALQYLADQPIDLVLLDLSLPDGWGLNSLKHIHKQFPEMPIIILTGADDEAMAIEAMKAGAQDYLVKGQVDSELLARAMRYAIERQQLLIALQQQHARQLAQKEQAHAVELRSYRHYLAQSQDEASADLDLQPHPDEEILHALLPSYRDLVIQYIRAMRLPEERPSREIREFAWRLAAVRARARDVVQLHLEVIAALSERISPTDERTFSNDARLILVELMGNLLDVYRIGAAKDRLGGDS